MLGIKLLCVVLSICFENCRSKPGISRNTETRLNKIPLHNTRPKSIPILSCMSIRAARPDIVVKLDELISTIAFESAVIIASLVSRCSFSSANRCESIIE